MTNKRWFMPLVASLTLGLVPFTPKPHIWDKLLWVLGGAEGMLPMDWFDFVMHGAPWIWLIWEVFQSIKAKTE